MWVVKIMEDFEIEPSPDNRIRIPFPIVMNTGKMVGYLPVYETLEDAKAEYPNADYMKIERKIQEATKTIEEEMRL